MPEPLRVVVWNEGQHTTSRPEMAKLYPHGIHDTIADALRRLLGDRASVSTATLCEHDHGLTPEVLDETDVLLWWGHLAHEQVSDAIVSRVKDRVLAGMGLIVLHSGHFSKIFISLMGTTCSLKWRNDGDRELVWTTAPTHPIAADVTAPIILDHHETYSEFFDIPRPDDVVFISSSAGGEVFRSGVTFTRGKGRIFYFSPGDEAYPIFHQPDVQQVRANAVKWAHRRAAITTPLVAENITRRATTN